MKLPALPTLKPRERLFGTGTGVVLLVLLLDRLVLAPWWRHAQTIRQETRRMEASMQQYGRLLARKDRILAQVQTDAPYLRPPVADELQMAVLIKEIETLAAQSQVQLGEVKPLAIEVSGSIKRYSLDVQLECTLEQWVDFVTQLEASPSLYQIARATLSTQEQALDQLKGSLRVVSATLRPEELGGQAHGTRTP